MTTLLRLIERVPGGARLVRSDRFHIRLGMVHGAQAVRTRRRFALNELCMRRGLKSYELRGSGRRIIVRHPMSDAWVVDEVINRQTYRPPQVVEDALRRLGRPLRIVDLGGHIGMTSLFMLDQFPGARVDTFEPNPESARIMQTMLRANGLEDRCHLHVAAAGVRDGSALIEGFSLLSHFVRDDEVEALDTLPFLKGVHAEESHRERVEVLDVLPYLQDADLAKIDIEGGEWAILADARFTTSGLTALVLEYHPQEAPGPDPLTAVRRLLGDAGFTTGEPHGAAGGVGTLWAWRTPA